ncbi:MAG TPA: DEAD/DEAH box helicase [Spirochaetia bacterium]|nr:DEAD/DEAH box helicase [Spirochaetia bacterium]
MTFSDFSLSEPLCASVRRMGFDHPTPIQTAAIPPALEGRDVLASAQTGSGKTAAFLLPIMNKLLPKQRGATRALVLAPTRELAAQIAGHFKELAAGTRLTCAAVHGGVGMGSQERAFRKGVDMIVACPGRLLDHMRGPHVDFSSLEHLVLDEADRMLDMGFLPDIKKVLAALPKDRQTFFFSATLPPAIVELSRTLLRDPARIDIDRKPAAAAGVSHSVFAVPSERKTGFLITLLGGEVKGSVLVFTRTKHRANRLAESLEQNGVPCARIHGNRSQSQRTAALAGFKSGDFRVLVATDIAARGIDVEALGSVVNFDVPHQPEDYIHRVGRTARAELTGDAYTLVSPDEENDFAAIEHTLGKRLPRRKLEGFDYAAPPRAAGQGGAGPSRPAESRRTADGSRTGRSRHAQASRHGNVERRAPAQRRRRRSFGRSA